MKLTPDQVTTSEVTEWQGVHLLHYHMSSCSQKVRILLGELGVDFESHHVDLRQNQQKSDWYVGINPNGVVPTLVHNGDVHIESNDIIAYLNTQFAAPDTSLLPSNAEDEEALQELLDLEDQLHADLRTVTFTYIAPAIHGDPEADENLGYIGRFHDAFARLNQRLAERTYLFGDKLTLPDVAWFITLHRLALAGYPLEEHAHLERYYRRLSHRPAFKAQIAAGPLPLRLAGFVYRTCLRLKRSLARDYARWRQGAEASPEASRG